MVGTQGYPHQVTPWGFDSPHIHYGVYQPRPRERPAPARSWRRSLTSPTWTWRRPTSSASAGQTALAPAANARSTVSYLTTRRLWKCKGCTYEYSVKKGTIFEDSAIGLDKWLPAVWLVASCKNAISSHEAARALGVCQKTAWFMLHRIRPSCRRGPREVLKEVRRGRGSGRNADRRESRNPSWPAAASSPARMDGSTRA